MPIPRVIVEPDAEDKVLELIETKGFKMRSMRMHVSTDKPRNRSG